ncbi:MAG: sialate O-acetylesterase [Chthoniobacteraceae bacterium]
MTPHIPSVRRFFLAATAATLLPLGASAEVKLPALFSEHMVLQRDQVVPVWGWADAGEEVTVTIGKQTKKTKAGADKKWSVKLDKLSAGELGTMTVKGTNTIEIPDVLVGEVWLCSGQSNMGFTVNRAVNFEQEKAAADLPKLRMFTVLSGTAPAPEEDCKGKWVICSPDTVGTFSAAAYFFGRDLHAKLNVPMGLINSSVGGTAIESWTSWDAQKDVASLKFIFDSWDQRIAAYDPEKSKAAYEKQKAAWQTAADKAKAEGKPAPNAPRAPSEPKKDANRPANLFNGKIAPLVPYAIRGAIWYQGESNADTVQRGAAYRVQLPLMIADWRKRWGSDFPFAWVQLPDFNAKNPEGWSLVREAMLKSLKIPKTGMAVALGLGEAGDIHPKRKQEVGKLLATWALADVYAPKPGKKAKAEPQTAMGPLYSGSKISGKEVTVTFTQAAGLTAKDGEVKGFTIAGEDKQWKPATAKIVKGSVVVSSPEVAKPLAGRYAWASNPEWSLVNAAGIPASPFRTDDWPAVEAAPATKP